MPCLLPQRSVKHVLGLASCQPAPAASCPRNAGLPVIFHPGCGLCPNEMFSYVPVIGLGPVQVSLFIQAPSPPLSLLEPPTSSAGRLLLRALLLPALTAPLLQGNGRIFLSKSQKKKKPSNPPRKIPMAQLRSWARNKAAPGTGAVSCFQSCLCTGTSAWN